MQFLNQNNAKKIHEQGTKIVSKDRISITDPFASDSRMPWSDHSITWFCLYLK